MTAKRFEFREINEPPILPKCYDTEKQEYANLFECVGWLNELHEENHQLERQVGNLEHIRDFCAEDCERLEKEIEQLKSENLILKGKLHQLLLKCGKQEEEIKMTEKFTIESERINNTYSIHIRKDGEVIFEISNWNSLSEMHKVECEEFVDYLNEVTHENKELKQRVAELELLNDGL